MISKTIILIVPICTIVFNLTIPGIWGQNSSLSSTEIQKLNSVTIQNTSTSMPAPSAKINNQQVPHSIVVALPIRSDGKIWIGTVTFTASKPIEIEVVHQYLPKVKPDINHGEPSNAKWFDGAPIALSTMTMFSNTPVTITDKPFSVGSFNFAGSALLFHKTNGQPFSVTYTLDAIAKNLTIIK
jgi:hypothetical protein